MKLRKIMMIIFTILFSGLGVLFGCNGKYDKLKISVAGENTNITLIADSQDEELRTSEVTINIENAPNENSKKINVQASNPNVVYWEEVSNSSNSVTFKIYPIENILDDNFSTTLTFTTQEGNKSCSINVKVEIPISTVEINDEYKPYVVADGDYYSINTLNAFVFTPANSTQKDMIYSLKNAESIDADHGLVVLEDGRMKIKSVVANGQGLSSFTVIAKNKYSEDLNTTKEIKVSVLKSLTLEDFIIKTSLNNDKVYTGQEGITELKENGLKLSSNTENRLSTFNVELNSKSGLVFDDLNIYFKDYVLSNVTIDKVDFTFTSLAPNVDYATLVISYKHFEDYTLEINFPVEVREAATLLTVNSSAKDEYYIYEQYENGKGQEFKVNVGSAGAYDKTFRIEVSNNAGTSSAFDFISILYNNENLNENLLQNLIFDNNSSIYVRAKQLSNKENIKIKFIANGSDADKDVSKEINLKLLESITELNFLSTAPVLYLENGKELKLNYLVNNSQDNLAFKDSVKLMVESTNGELFSVTKGEDDLSFTLKGLKRGRATVYLASENGYESHTRIIEVYDRVENVDFEKYIQVGENLKRLFNTEDETYYYYIGLSAGKNTANIKIVNSENISIYSTSISTKEGADSTIVNAYSISNDGLTFFVQALKEGITTLQITINTFKPNDEVNSTGEQVYVSNIVEINIVVYAPITDVSLKSESITVVDGKTLDEDSKNNNLDKIFYSDILNISKYNATNVEAKDVVVEYYIPSIYKVYYRSLKNEENGEDLNKCLEDEAEIVVGKDYSLSFSMIKTKTFVNGEHNLYITASVHDVMGLDYYTETFKVIVKAPVNAKSIHLKDDNGFIYLTNISAFEQIEVEVVGDNGKEATNKNVAFATKDLGIEVSENGIITPKSSGIYQVTAYAKAGIKSEDDFTNSGVKLDITVVVADGTRTYPYILEDFAQINSEKYYTLNKNIFIDSSLVSINTFKGGIDGQFAYSKYSSNALSSNCSIISNLSTSLFETNSGIVKNLNFVVNTKTFAISNQNFGFICQTNNGTIDNVSVEANNVKIEANGGNIGLIAGANGAKNTDVSAIINNCYVSGNITINTYNNITFGGLVGINYSKALVKGNYDFFEDSASMYNSTIIVKFDDAYANTIGGVVGTNNGEIKNISSKAVITAGAANCLGGIVASNISSIENVLFEGVIYAPEANNVGGIAGISEGTINLAFVVFEFSNMTLTANNNVKAFITANNNVGGLVGDSSGTISNSFAQSLVKYGDVDFEADIIANNNVGGLVGEASGKISVASSSINIKAISAGGLVGQASSLTVRDAYSLTEVKAEKGGIIGAFFVADESGVSLEKVYSKTAPYTLDETNETNYIYGKDDLDKLDKTVFTTSPWRSNTNINSGYPYLTYEGNNLTMVEPTKITASFISGEAVEGSDNYYFSKKYQNVIVIEEDINYEKAIVYYAKDLKLNIKDLINVSTYPSSSNVILNYTSSDENVLSVKNGKIKIINSGDAKIVISYDNGSGTIFDELYISVVKKINSLSMSESPINIIRGRTKLVSTIVNPIADNFGLMFDFYADGKLLPLMLNNKQVSNINYSENTENLFTALNSSSNQETTFNFNIIPYYIVAFNGVQYKVFEYSAALESLKVRIIDGATEISTDITNLTLTEKDVVSFDVFVKTTNDNEELIVEANNLSVSGQNTFDFNNKKFTLEIAIDGNVKLDKELNETITIYPESNKNISILINVKLLPSNLMSIELNHFNTIDQDDNGIRAEKEPTKYITPGEVGILKINLHPSYADIKKVSIESNVVNGAAIQFSQVAISNEKNRYVLISNNGIEGRTLLLNKVSYIDINNKNQFDGALYVTTLLPTDVLVDTIFTITVVCEYGPSHTPMIEPISLKAVPLPGAYLSLHGQTNVVIAKGTSVEFDLNRISFEGKPTFKVLLNGVKLEDLDEDEETITTEAFEINEIKDDFGNTYKCVISSSILTQYVGKTLEVRTAVTAYVNGKNVTIEKSTYITIVDFKVVDVIVEGYENDIITNYIGSSTTLKVKLVVDMAERKAGFNENEIAEYQNLELRIKALEESLSKDFTVFNTITRNANTSYVYNNIVPNTDYTNFKTEFSGDYLAVKGIKKSSQEIAVKFNIKYNSNGFVEKTKEAGYEILKYVYLQIESFTSSDHPAPITTYEQFTQMEEGENYILLSDITLPKTYTPKIANFKSLDGNGYKINLQGFDFTETDKNIGVFSEILSGTLIKNLKVNILPNGYYLNNVYRYGFEVNAQTLSSLNFGIFAGVNNGIITNCSVVNENIINKLSAEQVISINIKGVEANNFNVALFVAQNNGYITNSRVNNQTTDTIQCITLYSNANTAGFVVNNSGKIASSFVTNISIFNNAKLLPTAGFVLNNSLQVVTSFVEGVKKVNQHEQIELGGINSVYNAAGFVYDNSGLVKDSFSNLPLVSNKRSAGFVYDNTKGHIETCYSASKLQGTETEGNFSYRSFTGNNEENIVLNSKGGIINSYYVAGSHKYGSDLDEYAEPATGILASDFFNAASLNGFISGENGIWDVKDDYLPVLIDATTLASSTRILVDESQLDSSEVSSYDYIYINNNIGTNNNPILVSTTKELIDALTEAKNLYTYYFNGKKVETKINYQNIRLISDIDLSKIEKDGVLVDSTEEVQELQSIILAGQLDGNGMNIENVVIAAQNSNVNYDSFGLFKQIGVDFSYNQKGVIENIYLDSSNSTVVKNINFNINSISATLTRSVGSLAGEIINTKLYNINVINNGGVVVTGSNMVGGIAGRISGNSKVSGVSSNVSVLATYDTILTQNLYFEAEQKNVFANNYTNINEEANVNKNINYAGGLFGVVDIYNVKFETYGESQTLNSKYRVAKVVREDVVETSLNSANLSYLKVFDDVQISGEITGGLFGLVSSGTKIHDVKFELNNSLTQNIIGNYAVGGISGENRGSINFATVSFDKYLQDEIDNKSVEEQLNYATSLFNSSNNTSTYTGGLVGYNNNGFITYSYNRANVIAENSRYVGGIVGLMDGGKLRYTYTTANIVAQSEVKNDNVVTTLKGYAGGSVGRLNSKINDVTFSNVVSANNIKKYNDNYNLASFVGYNAVNQSKSLTVSVISGYNLPLSFGNGLSLDSEKSQPSLTYEDYLNKNAQCFNRYQDDNNWDLENFIFPVLTYNYLTVRRNVDSEDDLRNLSGNGAYQLTKDIYLTSPWTPLAEFSGTLTSAERDVSEREVHGTKYYKIYNLNINSAYSTLGRNVGFFSQLDGAKVTNITFVVGTTYAEPSENHTGIYAPDNNAYISQRKVGDDWKNYNIADLGIKVNVSAASKGTEAGLGFVAGLAQNGSYIDNVHVVLGDNYNHLNPEYAIQTNLYKVGGLVGASYNSTISNVSVRTVNSGSKFKIFADSSKIDDLNKYQSVGGVIGYYEGDSKNVISNVYANNIEITTPNNTTSQHAIASLNAGIVIGEVVTDGTSKNISISNIKVENSTIAATSTTNLNIGILFGTVNSLKNDLKEYTKQTFELANNTITAGGAETINAGMFAGIATDSVIQCVKVQNDNKLVVNATKHAYIGGLVGNLKGKNSKLNNSYSYGKINITYDNNIENLFAGGLIGNNMGNLGGDIGSAELVNTYSKARLYVYAKGQKAPDSNVYVAGAVGVNNGNIKNVSSLSIIRAITNDSMNVAPFVAKNETGVIDNTTCYYSSELAGVSPRDGEYDDKVKNGEYGTDLKYNKLVSQQNLEFDDDCKENSENNILKPENITNLSSLSNGKYYILSDEIHDNIVIEDSSLTDFNGVLIGNGKTVMLKGNKSLFNSLGEDAVISNLNIIAQEIGVYSYDLISDKDENNNPIQHYLNSNTIIAQENAGIINFVNVAGNLYTQLETQDVNIASFVVTNKGVIINSGSKTNIVIDHGKYEKETEIKNYIAGFVAQNSGLIFNSFTSSNIDIIHGAPSIKYKANKFKNIAGFVGSNTKIVQNCYSATTLPELSEDSNKARPFHVSNESSEKAVLLNNYFDAYSVGSYDVLAVDTNNAFNSVINNATKEEVSALETSKLYSNDIKDASSSKTTLFKNYSNLWQHNDNINYGYIYPSVYDTENSVLTTKFSVEENETNKEYYAVNNIQTLNHFAKMGNVILNNNINGRLKLYRKSNITNVYEHKALDLVGKTLNGNNFAIKNLMAKILPDNKDTTQYMGLVYNTGKDADGNVVSATVKNLALYNLDYNFNITNEKDNVNAYIGAIVASGNISIENCFATGKITSNAYESKNGLQSKNSCLGEIYVGGLAGETSGKIINSASNVEIISNFKYGDFVEKEDSNTEQEYKGKTGYIGGLAGKTTNSITDSFSLGKIQVSNFAALNLGGVAGLVEQKSTTETTETENIAEEANGSESITLENLFTISQVVYSGYYPHYYSNRPDNEIESLYYNINAVFGKVSPSVSLSSIKFNKKLSLVDDNNILEKDKYSILIDGAFFITSEDYEVNNFTKSGSYCLITEFTEKGCALNPHIVIQEDEYDEDGKLVKSALSELQKKINSQIDPELDLEQIYGCYIVSAEGTLELTNSDIVIDNGDGTTKTETKTNSIGDFANGYVIFDNDSGGNVQITINRKSGTTELRLFETLNNAIVAGIDFVDNGKKIDNVGILADNVTNNSVVNNITANELYVAPTITSEVDTYGLLINKVEENSVISNIDVINGRYQVNKSTIDDSEESQQVIYAGIIGTAKDSNLSYIYNSATITSATGAYLAGIVAKTDNSYLSFLTNDGLIYSKVNDDNEVRAAGISVYMSGGSISFSKNLVQVQAASPKGGIARASGLVITNGDASMIYMLYCFNDGKVISISNNSNTVSAGLLIEPASEDYHIIYFSYNKGAMLSSNYAYALTNMKDSENKETVNINNCYSIGGGYSAKAGASKIDLFVGNHVGRYLADADTLSNKYDPNKESTIADAILTNAKADFEMNKFLIDNKGIIFPINFKIDEPFKLNWIKCSENCDWDGERENCKDGCDGYYEISTPFELYYWISFVGEGNVELLKDIDMSGYQTSSIDGKYTGTFNGNNHSIENLQIKETIIPEDIKDENEAVVLKQYDLAAAFILYNAGTITNVHFVDPMVSTKEVGVNNYIGVVAGVNTGTISNVLVSASYNGVRFIDINYVGAHSENVGLETTLNIGVICGQNNSIIENCEVINLYNGLNINAKYEFEAQTLEIFNMDTGFGLSLEGVSSAVGGLVGRNNGKISNAAHFGAINVHIFNTGRIGNMGSDFVMSMPAARLDSWTGPIAGYRVANSEDESKGIFNCYAKSNFVELAEKDIPTTIISYTYENAGASKSNKVGDLSVTLDEVGQGTARFFERAIPIGKSQAKINAANKTAKEIENAGKEVLKHADDYVDGGADVLKKFDTVKDATKATAKTARVINPIGWVLLALDIGIGAYNDWLTNIPSLDHTDYTKDFNKGTSYLLTNASEEYHSDIYRILVGDNFNNNVLIDFANLNPSLNAEQVDEKFGELTYYILSNFYEHKDVNSEPKRIRKYDSTTQSEKDYYYIYSTDEFAYALTFTKIETDENGNEKIVPDSSKKATFILMNSIDLTKRVWDENCKKMENITVISNEFEVKYKETLTFGSDGEFTTKNGFTDDFGLNEKIVRDLAKIKMETFINAFKALGNYESDVITADNTYNIKNSAQLYLIGVFLNTYDDINNPMWKVPLTFNNINFKIASSKIIISSANLCLESRRIASICDISRDMIVDTAKYITTSKDAAGNDIEKYTPFAMIGIDNYYGKAYKDEDEVKYLATMPFCGNIDGMINDEDNYTIKLESDVAPLFNRFGGTLSNLNINVVATGASYTVKNAMFSYVANENDGVITNVSVQAPKTINITQELTEMGHPIPVKDENDDVTHYETAVNDTLYFGLISALNYKEINSCSIKTEETKVNITYDVSKVERTYNLYARDKDGNIIRTEEAIELDPSNIDINLSATMGLVAGFNGGLINDMAFETVNFTTNIARIDGNTYNVNGEDKPKINGLKSFVFTSGIVAGENAYDVNGEFINSDEKTGITNITINNAELNLHESGEDFSKITNYLFDIYCSNVGGICGTHSTNITNCGVYNLGMNVPSTDVKVVEVDNNKTGHLFATYKGLIAGNILPQVYVKEIIHGTIEEDDDELICTTKYIYSISNPKLTNCFAGQGSIESLWGNLQAVYYQPASETIDLGDKNVIYYGIQTAYSNDENWSFVGKHALSQYEYCYWENNAEDNLVDEDYIENYIEAKNQNEAYNYVKFLDEQTQTYTFNVATDDYEFKDSGLEDKYKDANGDVYNINFGEAEITNLTVSANFTTEKTIDEETKTFKLQGEFSISSSDHTINIITTQGCVSNFELKWNKDSQTVIAETNRPVDENGDLVLDGDDKIQISKQEGDKTLLGYKDVIVTWNWVRVIDKENSKYDFNGTYEETISTGKTYTLIPYITNVSYSEIYYLEASPAN